MKRNIFLKGHIFWSDDTCFFSGQQAIKTNLVYKRLKRFSKKNPGWYKNITGEEPKGDGWSMYHTLRDKYRSLLHLEVYHHEEIDCGWMNDLDPLIQMQIKFESTIHVVDEFSIVPTIPFTGIGYFIKADGFVNDFFDKLKMYRLFNVLQLGFMHDSVHREYDPGTLALDFHHTRGLHHLDVYTIMKLIIENNPCLQPKKMPLLAAAISHDGKTPAGGDTTKLIDLELFDEEKNYKDYFTTDGWKSLSKRYELDENEVFSIVQGEGLLGSVLDIADKIAYTARDSWMFMGMEDPHYSDYRSDYFMQGKRLLYEDPLICDLWQDVRIINDKLVVINGRKLAKFLKLRAIMFKELYYKRESRFLEYMLSKKVIEYLFKYKYITFDELLTWPDFLLQQKINEFFGVTFLPSCFTHAKIHICKTQEEAYQCYAQYINTNEYIPIMDDFKTVTSDATKKFYVLQNGKIGKFCDLYPNESEEIKKIMTFPQEYGVYAIAASDLDVPEEQYHLINHFKKEALL